MKLMRGANNSTAIIEFFIRGLPDLPEMHMYFFMVFLLIYFLTMTANMTIIGLVWMDHHLHTPMYFFLGNYSFLEMMYVSTTVPKLLDIYRSGNYAISFSACIAQLYTFTVLGVTESFFLVVMSYDRYLAICSPLHYATIMSQRSCTFLVLGSWAAAVLISASPLVMIARLPFCGPNEIDHFLCESAPLLQLACSDTTFSKTILSVFASISILGSFLFIMVSYSYIIITIMRIPSRRGKKKAFSTCSSHLTVVMIFYVTSSVSYVRPAESNPLQNKIVAAFYAIVIPLLNPFIYSLRNKDMQEALRSVFRRASQCATHTDIMRVIVQEEKKNW
ncbi:olfactory receptor 6M1-like [Ambystoma mexicanum]|uniref:olfactory receptor 6M1-like n=1 Tax=Ambystoma mexicanum TaxID=8296 RepID=UPI0037E86434